METIEELRELNLEDNEVKIYLTCLTLGSSKVSDISQKSQIVRTTVYGILKSLIQKGIVSTVIKDNVTFYNAANPEQLVEILEEKKRKVNSILPKLKEMQKYIPNKHKVELFEGKEGFKTIVNQLVSIPNEIFYVIAPLSKWIDMFDFFLQLFIGRKKK